jgi:hypothetical protein
VGADLILCYAAVPDPFTDDTVGELRGIAKNPPQKIVDVLLEYIHQGDSTDEEVLEEVQDILLGAVNTVFVEFFHQEGMHREMDVLEIRGHKYIFTGGMSWGDGPTDVYDDVWRAGLVSSHLEEMRKELIASGITT